MPTLRSPDPPRERQPAPSDPKTERRQGRSDCPVASDLPQGGSRDPVGGRACPGIQHSRDIAPASKIGKVFDVGSQTPARISLKGTGQATNALAAWPQCPPERNLFSFCGLVTNWHEIKPFHWHMPAIPAAISGFASMLSATNSRAVGNSISGSTIRSIKPKANASPAVSF